MYCLIFYGTKHPNSASSTNTILIILYCIILYCIVPISHFIRMHYIVLYHIVTYQLSMILTWMRFPELWWVPAADHQWRCRDSSWPPGSKAAAGQRGHEWGDPRWLRQYTSPADCPPPPGPSSPQSFLQWETGCPGERTWKKEEDRYEQACWVSYVTGETKTTTLCFMGRKVYKINQGHLWRHQFFLLSWSLLTRWWWPQASWWLHSGSQRSPWGLGPAASCCQWRDQSTWRKPPCPEHWLH